VSDDLSGLAADAYFWPADRFVSINNDTIYSIAQVDVSGGPVLLPVPDTAGRYYVLQFADAWTNNFAYVGRRATGTAAGSFLLTPPGWQADAPQGATVIEFPTTAGTIVGRWACDGPADLDDVKALQGKLTLESCGAPAPRAGVPDPAKVRDELAFFEQLRTWMQAFPPSDEDLDYQQRFAPLGLLDLNSPYRDCPPELARALTAGADADGSLTIVIQHDQPADTRNWLPAPAAPFRPLLRLYQPQAAVLDRTYQIPPITKVSS
jgi:hypothetical protein